VRGSGGHGSPFLDAFLQPVEHNRFVSDYWERRPLHVQRRHADHYAGLFDLSDADSLLSSSGGLWSSAVRVVQNGSVATNIGSASRVEAIYRAYRTGATLIFSSLQERWTSVRAFHFELSSALTASVNINAYLTPPNAAGFPVHYDTHDVFVLQTSGVKRWRIYPPLVPLPLKSQTFKKDMLPADLDTRDPVLDVRLDAGDMLYIPRGFLHAAEACERASLHLTVGVSVTTWSTLLESALRSVVNSRPEFREGLPPGFGSDDSVRAEVAASLDGMCRRAIECTDWDEIVGNAAADAELVRRPDLDGHLLDLDRTPDLKADTLLRKPVDCRWFIGRTSDRLRLSLHGKDLLVPLRLEEALRFIDTAGVFTARDIPGALDVAGRLVLVRRLLLEGALTHADQPRAQVNSRRRGF
jgi:ribosomal protein L16 Arg81 hydroxylase